MRSLKFIQVYSSYQGAQLDSTLTLLFFFSTFFGNSPTLTSLPLTTTITSSQNTPFNACRPAHSAPTPADNLPPLRAIIRVQTPERLSNWRSIASTTTNVIFFQFSNSSRYPPKLKLTKEIGRDTGRY